MAYIQKARTLAKEGRYERAGEYYSMESLESIASGWDNIRNNTGQFDGSGNLLSGFVWGEFAALYYLLGRPIRAENRSRQCILGLEDARNNLLDHPAWLGLAWELDGDFRHIENTNGSGESYDRALENFEELESSCNMSEIVAWAHEPGFTEMRDFLDKLSHTLDIDVQIGQPANMENGYSHSQRVSNKNRKFNKYIRHIEGK